MANSSASVCLQSRLLSDIGHRLLYCPDISDICICASFEPSDDAAQKSTSLGVQFRCICLYQVHHLIGLASFSRFLLQGGVTSHDDRS
jgi:hypothetical protein